MKKLAYYSTIPKRYGISPHRDFDVYFKNSEFHKRVGVFSDGQKFGIELELMQGHEQSWL